MAGRSITAILFGVLCAPSYAQTSTSVAPVIPNGSLTAKMSITQKLGSQVPAAAQFKDESGKTIRFGELFGKRPIILLPMFFRCNGVCKLETDGLVTTMYKDKKLTVGKDVDVVMLSIHPKETPELARGKKELVTAAYNRPGTENGWHFLTGDLASIRQVTDAVGFKYEYNEAQDRINHPAGVVFLTPSGHVSSYIYGSEYATTIVEDDVAAARNESVGVKPEVILLGCVTTDPVTHQKTLVVEQLLKVLGCATVAILFTCIAVMSFKHRRYPLPPLGPDGGTPSGQ